MTLAASAMHAPPLGFFQTSATIILTAVIALLFQIRYLQRPADARSDDSGQKLDKLLRANEKMLRLHLTMIALVIFTTLLGGLLAALAALYKGPTVDLGQTVRAANVLALTSLFGGGFIPYIRQAVEGHKLRWAIPLGVGLLVYFMVISTVLVFRYM
jgi:fucose permease